MRSSNHAQCIFLILLIFFIITASIPVFAHSGRTDSRGGHHDNYNASGLGFYHYHCGSHPAHLHPGGVCPYKDANNDIDKFAKSYIDEIDIFNLVYLICVIVLLIFLYFYTFIIFVKGTKKLKKKCPLCGRKCPTKDVYCSCGWNFIEKKYQSYKFHKKDP